MAKHALFGCLLFGWLGFAPSLLAMPTVSSVFESIKQHHPRMKEAAARRAQAEQEVDIALSAYDLLIDQTSKFRLSGFYDGHYSNQRITKRIETLGAQVYSGYRISEGDFPSYEGDTVTLSGGEVSFGVAVPLFRNRETDSYRTALKNARLSEVLGLTQEAIALNNLLYDGMLAFLQWYETSLRYQTVSELVRATESRLKGVKERVEHGDLASISLTEFNSTLLGRKVLLRQAEQDLELSKRVLAFYWRDQNGQMKSPDHIPQAKAHVAWPFALNQTQLAQLTHQLDAHPQLQALRAQFQQASNDALLKNNKLLPKVDLGFEVSNDFGRGSETLAQAENKLELKLSIPLGQRKAKAELNQAKLKVEQLNYALVNLANELERDIAMAIENLNYQQSVVDLQREQVNLAQALVEQEVVRFDSGTSDLFLLNNREAQSIESKLSLIHSQVALYRQTLRVWALSGTLAEAEVSESLVPESQVSVTTSALESESAVTRFTHVSDN